MPKSPASYYFAQQRDSSCHLLPFINLSILKSMRLRGGEDINVKEQGQAYTRRDWLPETFKWTQAWQVAMKQLYENEGDFYELQLKKQEEGLTQGAVYKKNGKKVTDVKNPIKKMKRMLLYPYNFTDIDAIPADYQGEHRGHAYKTLPLVLDEGAIKCFNPETNAYDVLELVDFPNEFDVAVSIPTHNDFLLNENNKNKLSSGYLYCKLSDMQKSYLKLSKEEYLYFSTHGLGFDVIFQHRYLPEASENNTYYMSGLAQLILFGMGVDRDNQEIDHHHAEYDAYSELKQTFENEHNPWGLDTFDKENLLEYHLANMIQADPNLKKEMEATVNVGFNTWKYYKNLNNLYDEQGESLAARKRHLMGDAQYLAYCYTQSVRMLWAAATSNKAFAAVLDLDPTMARLLRLPGMPGTNYWIKKAKHKQSGGKSFLDVWQTIRQKLKDNPDIPDEMASFSGHGVVMSLKEDLLLAQKASGNERQDILDQLGIAVIDSYYGEQLSPMYRETGPTPSNQVPCSIAAMIQSKRIEKIEKAEMSQPLRHSFIHQPASKKYLSKQQSDNNHSPARSSKRNKRG